MSRNSVFDRPPNTSSKIQCMKYTLYLMFTLITIGGFAVLGIGIWSLMSEYGGRQLSGLIGVHLYLIDSYLLIISGCTILLITLIGCCGAFHEIKCMLGLHLAIMVFLSITLVVGGGLGFAFRGELEESVREQMVTSLSEMYGVNVDMHSENKDVTKAWDLVQESFGCCGAWGDLNTTSSWALYKTESNWYKDGYNNNSYVPESCCVQSGNLSVCTGITETDGPPSVGPPVPLAKAKGLSLYTTGCYDKMVDVLEANGLVIGVTAIVVATFIFVEVVICICLYRNVR